jgi:hypothetical protein
MANMSFGSGGSSYFDLAKNQQVFIATANVTAPVIYTTAAGTGGPLIWNNSGPAGIKRVMAVLLAVGVGITTASGAASSLGITGNSGQTSAPTSTTAIDAQACSFVGGSTSVCSVYRVGTVATAGNFFMPFCALGTGALTVDNVDYMWHDLGGSIVVPSGSWAAVAAAATATSAVLQIGLMWAEVPY